MASLPISKPVPPGIGKIPRRKKEDIEMDVVESNTLVTGSRLLEYRQVPKNAGKKWTANEQEM